MLSCIKYKKLWKQKGGTLLVLITVTPSYHCPGASSCLSLHVIPVKEWQPVHHLSPPFTQCQLGRLQPQCDPGWISGQRNGWWKQTIMLRCSYICVQHNTKYMDIFHYTYSVLLKILCVLYICHTVWKCTFCPGNSQLFKCVVNSVVGPQNNTAATCLFSCSSTSHPLVGKGKDKCWIIKFHKQKHTR